MQPGYCDTARDGLQRRSLFRSQYSDAQSDNRRRRAPGNPLVKFAKILGFHITVLDDRVIYANRERFPDADEVLAGDMAETFAASRSRRKPILCSLPAAISSTSPA